MRRKFFLLTCMLLMGFALLSIGSTAYALDSMNTGNPPELQDPFIAIDENEKGTSDGKIETTNEILNPLEDSPMVETSEDTISVSEKVLRIN